MIKISHQPNLSLLALYLFCYVVIFLPGCLDLASGCETEVSRRIPSPDNSLQAISMVTDCGATTSTSYGVRIVESLDTTDKGNQYNTIMHSNSSVRIKWLTNDTLLITGADTTNGFKLKSRLRLKKSDKEVIILFIK